jgi:hypothetical protein
MRTARVGRDRRLPPTLILTSSWAKRFQVHLPRQVIPTRRAKRTKNGSRPLVDIAQRREVDHGLDQGDEIPEECCQRQRRRGGTVPPGRVGRYWGRRCARGRWVDTAGAASGPSACEYACDRACGRTSRRSQSRSRRMRTPQSGGFGYRRRHGVQCAVAPSLLAPPILAPPILAPSLLAPSLLAPSLQASGVPPALVPGPPCTRLSSRMVS